MEVWDEGNSGGFSALHNDDDGRGMGGPLLQQCRKRGDPCCIHSFVFTFGKKKE